MKNTKHLLVFLLLAILFFTAGFSVSSALTSEEGITTVELKNTTGKNIRDVKVYSQFDGGQSTFNIREMAGNQISLVKLYDYGGSLSFHVSYVADTGEALKTESEFVLSDNYHINLSK